jgi:hypothetical protein
VFDQPSKDVADVLAGKCIQPKCTATVKMGKQMPHEDSTDPPEFICEACNVYYTIMNNQWVITNHDAMKEYNRRWREYMDEMGIGEEWTG